MATRIETRQGNTVVKTVAVLTRAALLVTTVLVSVQTASAARGEFQDTEDDLLLKVDARWPGCRTGGYYPIRIQLQNRAADRTVTVRFVPDRSGLPSVSRTLDLSQNASVSTSLLIPMIGEANRGQLIVSDQTGVLRTLTQYFTIAPAKLSGNSLSLLAISEQVLDFSGFEDAVDELFGGSAGYSGTASDDYAVAHPDWLPDTWIAYSGLDLVAVSRATLAGLAQQSRSALLDWVKARGILIVHEVGEHPADCSELNGLLEIEQASRSVRWGPPRSSESADLFSVRSLGLGIVVGLEHQIFRGSRNDWPRLLNMLRSHRLQSAERIGVAGRAGNDGFMTFLIPGVQSVPVFTFLIFITVFTVVIGPFNYYLLSRRKRLNLLLISIPGIALVTSLLLFMYSVFAHGFTVKSRVRSVTVLDQGSQQAVATARLALYAGSTPSRGLEFSQRTAVTPIWPAGQAFQSGRVDWSQTQALTSGFLRSRTRTQFLTTQVRDERGRLTIQSGNDELDVANGLEWDLSALIVVDGEGRQFAGADLPAGDSRKLSPVTDQDSKLALQLLERSRPALPAGVSSRDLVSSRRQWTSRNYGEPRRSYTVLSGSMEQQISDMARKIRGDAPFEKRSYLAFIRENTEQSPVELGTETTVVDGWHIVIGYY